jgi:hypothetical protein
MTCGTFATRRRPRWLRPRSVDILALGPVSSMNHVCIMSCARPDARSMAVRQAVVARESCGIHGTQSER